MTPTNRWGHPFLFSPILLWVVAIGACGAAVVLLRHWTAANFTVAWNAFFLGVCAATWPTIAITRSLVVKLKTARATSEAWRELALRGQGKA